MNAVHQGCAALGVVLCLATGLAIAAEPATNEEKSTPASGVEGVAKRTGELVDAGVAGTARVLKKATHAVAEGTRPVGEAIGQGGKAVADKTRDIASGDHGRKAATEKPAEKPAHDPAY